MRSDPIEERIRQNLIRFREEAKLSVAKASDLSGVPDANLRRYEDGTSGPPAAALKQLADAYGHDIGHFYVTEPPPADLDARPHYFLRVRPDADYTPELYAELQEVVDKINEQELIAVKKDKKKPRKK